MLYKIILFVQSLFTLCDYFPDLTNTYWKQISQRTNPTSTSNVYVLAPKCLDLGKQHWIGTLAILILDLEQKTTLSKYWNFQNRRYTGAWCLWTYWMFIHGEKYHPKWKSNISHLKPLHLNIFFTMSFWELYHCPLIQRAVSLIAGFQFLLESQWHLL